LLIAELKKATVDMGTDLELVVKAKEELHLLREQVEVRERLTEGKLRIEKQLREDVVCFVFLFRVAFSELTPLLFSAEL
jgi:hypothetical protein